MWYQMRAAEEGVHEVLVHDFIGDWIDGMLGMGVTAKAFLDELSALPESVKVIRVHVNSPGGDVFAAVAIANALRDQRMSKGRKVEMVVDGLAASAASLVIMAGDTIRMADNGLIMIHNAWTQARGNSADLRAEADRLEKLRDASIVPTYQWHSPLPASEIIKLMDAETWMDADEALSYGFATEKVSGLRAAASLTPAALASLVAPPTYAAKLEALAAQMAPPPPPVEEEEAPPAAPEPPVEEPPAAPEPAAEEPPAAEPEKKDPPTLLEEAKGHLKEALNIQEKLADGSLALDEKSMNELAEHLNLAAEALDAMPPMPKPMKEEAPEPAKEEPPPPAPPAEDQPAASVVPVSQARVELPVAPPAMSAAEVLKDCAVAKLSVEFAAALAASAPTRQELTAAVARERARIQADDSRKAGIRAMCKKHGMESIGELLANAGVGVTAAGRLVTELKALRDPVELDGALQHGPGARPRVLSYSEKIARANNPAAFKERK